MLPPTEIAGEAPRGGAALTTLPVSHVELPTKLLIRDTAELSLLQRKPGLRDSCETPTACVGGALQEKRQPVCLAEGKACFQSQCGSGGDWIFGLELSSHGSSGHDSLDIS